MTHKGKLPTKKQAELYAKLRKKGLSIKLADNLIKLPSLAKKILSIRKRKWH